ncbi:MAG: GNAT family N-acetyltransferase [Acidobacteriota bacterium]|nr:GNAT family N-acetyltransferase [Acidobacteriota bacterium]
MFRATAAEAATAFALIEEYYEAIGVVARDGRAALEHYLESPESPIFLVTVDGAPAGCVMLRPLPQVESALEVKRLWVRPEFRRHGLAHRLMQKAEEFAQEKGFAWLYLDTKDDLEAAIRFYLGSGYERCARYNDNPQATLFLRKHLPRQV